MKMVILKLVYKKTMNTNSKYHDQSKQEKTEKIERIAAYNVGQCLSSDSDILCN